MSEDALPPDPSSWPKDPFRLLGVTRGVSPRELRRAYLKLIRVYKPDHAPEQFRRIREAYEAAERLNVYFVQAPSDLEVAGVEEEAIPEFEPVREPADPGTSEGARTKSGPPPPDAWTRACAGELEAAYRMLIDGLDCGPPRQDDYLQLYWLLALTPGLDPVRPADDWLVRGLRRVGGSAWKLRELLGRTLAADPAATLGQRFGAVLAPGTDPSLVLVIAVLRWRAARSQGCAELIRADVNALSTWLPASDDGAWGRLLLCAAENLTWAAVDEADPAKNLRREVEHTGHHHQDFSEELYQLEYEESIMSELRQMGIKHPTVSGLYRLVSLPWNDDAPECRTQLQRHLRQLARNPQDSLKLLDQIQQRAPSLLGRLLELSTGPSTDGPWPVVATDPARISSCVEEFLAVNAWEAYRALRPRLLDFCLHEMIPPQVFAAAVVERPQYAVAGSQHIAHALAVDWPVHHVYRACAFTKG